jgi:para-aminobenzoate synthetase/4-amino-4-deoxychorismate lyase
MKGTAPRGMTTAEDDLIAKQLVASEKNRAENLMIVDLMRNDLGRIARIGSVHVPELFAIERYQSIFQMTSVVEAELRPEVGYADMLRAMFPSGSVTGAPKIRAMELIRELEAQPRGVYTGSIGYFARDHANLNVAIRTIEFEAAQAKLGAGSGIVADSIASEEFEECHAKANFLRASPQLFSILESFLWEGSKASFRHLDAHLQRMRDSAIYFGFPICDEGLDRALHNCEQELRTTSSGPVKMRLLLDRSGNVEITHVPLSTVRFSRVALAELRVSSLDRFLFHKTTNRALYDQAIVDAHGKKCDDLLFFNERGELTEGAIHNIFVDIYGELLTPPLSSGLLAGIERAHILQTNPRAREQVLYYDDLRNAKQVYLCNSVRGMYPVQLAEQRRTASP